MRLVRWQPRHVARRANESSLFGSWDRMMDEFFGLSGHCCEHEPTWTPRIDVREETDHYSVQVDLPGMSKKDIEVTLEDDVLTISGQREFEQAKENETLHRRERFSGKFSRSMSFPSDVDQDKVKAGFKDGVLTVEIMKSEQSRARQIDID